MGAMICDSKGQVQMEAYMFDKDLFSLVYYETRKISFGIKIA